jgi:hypothetical protein
MLDLLPAAVRHGFVDGYAGTIQTVFLVAVPIAALAFLATWLIPQVELRKWSHAAGEKKPEAVVGALESLDPQEAAPGA